MIWKHLQFFILPISGYDDQLLQQQQQRRPQHVQPYQHHVTSAAAGTMPRRSPPSLSSADSAPPPRRSSTLVRRGGGAHAPNQFPEVTSTTTQPYHHPQQQQRSVRFEEAGTESRRNEVGWVNIVLFSLLLNTDNKDTPCLQHSHNLGPALYSQALPTPVPYHSNPASRQE